MEITHIDNEYSRQWIVSNFSRRSGVHVPNAFVDINEGYASDAKIFAQIIYWHDINDKGEPRLQRKRNGHLWLTKNHDEWFAETRTKYHTARNCLDRLKARGLIIYELHGEKGDKTPWMRINWSRFEALMRIWESHQAQYANGITEKNYKILLNRIHLCLLLNGHDEPDGTGQYAVENIYNVPYDKDWLIHITPSGNSYTPVNNSNNTGGNSYTPSDNSQGGGGTKC